MRRIALVLTVAASMALVPARQSESGEEPGYLFVISAPSASMEGSTPTMRNVPSVVYFTDRPERETGHMSVDEYVDIWTPPEGATDFDPPNADLSVLGEDGDANTVVVLYSVSGDASESTFEIEVLEGSLAIRAVSRP